MSSRALEVINYVQKKRCRSRGPKFDVSADADGPAIARLADAVVKVAARDAAGDFTCGTPYYARDRIQEEAEEFMASGGGLWGDILGLPPREWMDVREERG